MDKLLQLANGSVALVEEAFTYARAEPGQPPTLDEIICYLMEKRGYHDFVARTRTKT